MRKYQYYNTGDDADRDIYSVNWSGQTFTPIIAHMIANIRVKLFRVGDPSTITISIKATSAGKPVGSDLCSGIIEGNTITEDAGGEWYQISMGNGCEVVKGVQYAIVIRAPSGDVSNKLSWRTDASAPTYTGGLYCGSSDSGTDWSTYSGSDAMFEEWGAGTPSPTTVTWGYLHKSQISTERIERAITRMIQNHEDDENAHVEVGESLNSHKASAIIDHVVNSIITDKILDGTITNAKIFPITRMYTAIVDIGGLGDFTDIQSAINYVVGLGIGGGTILIRPGTYVITNWIELASNIDLIGLDPLTTIIDGQKAGGTRISIDTGEIPYTTGTVSIAHDGTVVTGIGTVFIANTEAGWYIKLGHVWYEIESVDNDNALTLKHAFKGKAISGADTNVRAFMKHITIKGITIKGCGTGGMFPLTGFFVGDLIDSNIEDIIIEDGLNTAYVFNTCFNVNFRNNKARNNALGPVIHESTYCTIDGNNHDNEESGFNMLNIYHCTIKNNSANNCDGHGFSIVESDYNIIQNNKANNVKGTGFGILESVHNRIVGNEATECEDDGLLMLGAWPTNDNNIIDGNNFNDNGGYGINIDNGGHNEKTIVVNNQLRGNALGAYKDDGTDTEIAHNIED